MRLQIQKAARRLILSDGGRVILSARIALGWAPVGAKTREGDGKTPEGVYRVCLVKEDGRHGPSLGLSYPGPEDAKPALAEGRIDARTCAAILRAHRRGARPPWGTPLGGEIYIHAGGTRTDWTQGCIALEPADMAYLFFRREKIQDVEILP